MPASPKTIARLACLFASLAAAGGCNLIGVVADKTAGQIPVEPKHTPDPLVPLVVLVENYRTDSGNAGDADRVARMIGAR
ncbi:hypothetical protein EON77_16400, partial [bacterium]